MSFVLMSFCSMMCLSLTSLGPQAAPSLSIPQSIYQSNIAIMLLASTATGFIVICICILTINNHTNRPFLVLILFIGQQRVLLKFPC